VSNYIYDPTKPCPIDHRMVAVTAVMYGCDTTACGICKLPIGVPCEPIPAADTPHALVELRAAELALSTKGITIAEHDGFLDYEHDLDPPPADYAWNKPWQTGWLAREIFEHDRRQP